MIDLYRQYHPCLVKMVTIGGLAKALTFILVAFFFAGLLHCLRTATFDRNFDVFDNTKEGIWTCVVKLFV